MNRKHGTQRADLKKYMEKNARKPLAERYANFQLLLYLSREMDIDVLSFDRSLLSKSPAASDKRRQSQRFLTSL